MKKNIVLACLLGMLSFKGYTQGSFSSHLHIAPPSTIFGGGIGANFYGDIDYADPFGFAGVGIGVGLEYHHPFGKKNLSLLVSADIIRNPIKRAFRQQYKLSFESNETFKFSTYYNAPIMVGLHYDFEIKDFPLFIQGGPILDLLKVTDSKRTYVYSSGNSSTDVEKHALSFSIGYGIGVGVILNDKYILGLGYKRLGIHTIKNTSIYTFSDGDVNSYIGSTIKKIGVINITAGIQL